MICCSCACSIEIQSYQAFENLSSGIFEAEKLEPPTKLLKLPYQTRHFFDHRRCLRSRGVQVSRTTGIITARRKRQVASQRVVA